jgi:acyl carrier protein
MDREALKQTLKALVEETTGEPCPELTEDRDLRSGLGLDSVDMFSLIVDMQGQFQVKINSDEIEPVHSVGDLLDVLQRKLAGNTNNTPRTSAA